MVQFNITLKKNTGNSRARCLIHKGDVTQDDPQRQLLAQHNVAIWKQCCKHPKQCCNAVLC